MTELPPDFWDLPPGKQEAYWKAKPFIPSPSHMARPNGEAPKPPELKVYSAGDFAKTEAPPREWLVENIIPMNRVSLLYGNGGEGKSLINLQLGVAVATETDWIGKLPLQGTALILSCEDDRDECHRRVRDIIAGRDDLAAKNLDNLKIVDLAGEDALLATLAKNEIKLTPLFAKIEALVADFSPILLSIDTLADVYGGDENVRTQVRQFLGSLTKLATKYKMAVVILAHPSLYGIQTGTGSSGSTGWHNTVRARAYLKPQTTGDGQAPEPTLKQLEIMKSNYGLAGEIIKLQWRAERFVLPGALPPLSRMAAEAKIQQEFLANLEYRNSQHRTVSDKSGANYAPAVFAKDPEAIAAGTTAKQIEAAMNRLFKEGKIRVEIIGPPSRQTRKIVVADDPQS